MKLYHVSISVFDIELGIEYCDVIPVVASSEFEAIELTQADGFTTFACIELF